MIVVENINNNSIAYEHSTDACVGEYYNYCTSLLKKILSERNYGINIVFGNHYASFDNNNRVIKTDIQIEHTLVKPGGRDSHNNMYGNIPVPDTNQNYLVRIQNYNYFNSLDIIIDYSYPNLYNIKSCKQLDHISDKIAVISPLIYDHHCDKNNRTVNIITSFIDTNQPRRKLLLDNLKLNNIGCTNIRSFDKVELMNILRDSKILINIHQTDHHDTFEELRVLPALLNGVIVIAENSPLMETIPYHENIIWVPYGDMIRKVEDVSANYEKYRNAYISGEFKDKIDLMTIDNENNIRRAIQKKITNVNMETTHGFNAGFFSHCTVRLTKIMGYYRDNGVIPDTINSFNNWQKYKDDQSLDISQRFFKDNETNINIQGDLVYNKLSTSKTPLECHCSDLDQFTDFANMNYQHTNLFVNKYFDLSDEVLSAKKFLTDKYDINPYKTIGVCFRGNDKARETTIPSYGQVIEQTRRAMSENPDHKVFLQSDEIDIYEEFTRAGIEYIKIDEVTKIRRNGMLSAPDAVPQGHKTAQAVLFLAVMSILSDCDKLVLNTGNVGLWVCLLRGNCKNVAQFCNNAWIFN